MLVFWVDFVFGVEVGREFGACVCESRGEGFLWDELIEGALESF